MRSTRILASSDPAHCPLCLGPSWLAVAQARGRGPHHDGLALHSSCLCLSGLTSTLWLKNYGQNYIPLPLPIPHQRCAGRLLPTPTAQSFRLCIRVASCQSGNGERPFNVSSRPLSGKLSIAVPVGIDSSGEMAELRCSLAFLCALVIKRNADVPFTDVSDKQMAGYGPVPPAKLSASHYPPWPLWRSCRTFAHAQNPGAHVRAMASFAALPTRIVKSGSPLRSDAPHRLVMIRRSSIVTVP